MNKSHVPTKALRDTVTMHTMVGTPQDIIASIIGIDPKTLRKHYRDEINHARAQANATIGGALFNKAKNGDTAAQIFWLKTQAGFRESKEVEHDVHINNRKPLNIVVNVKPAKGEVKITRHDT